VGTHHARVVQMVGAVADVAEAVTVVVGFGSRHKTVLGHYGEADNLAVKMVVEGIGVLSQLVQVVVTTGGTYLEN